MYFAHKRPPIWSKKSLMYLRLKAFVRNGSLSEPALLGKGVGPYSGTPIRLWLSKKWPTYRLLLLFTLEDAPWKIGRVDGTSGVMRVAEYVGLKCSRIVPLKCAFLDTFLGQLNSRTSDCLREFSSLSRVGIQGSNHFTHTAAAWRRSGLKVHFFTNPFMQSSRKGWFRQADTLSYLTKSIHAKLKARTIAFNHTVTGNMVEYKQCSYSVRKAIKQAKH
jgi:hypothetical protein